MIARISSYTYKIKTMKKQTLILIFVSIFFACKKPPSPPKQTEMVYTHLNDKEIPFGQYHSIDLNNDGKLDFDFYTMLVGDPLAQQDKQKYLVGSRLHTLLPVNDQENAPILNQNDPIPFVDFQGYSWYPLSTIELAQKIISMSGPDVWEGLWKDSHHQYLPLQVTVGGQRFNGWIELSFEKETRKLILHKAAVSTKAETAVKAGV